MASFAREWGVYQILVHDIYGKHLGQNSTTCLQSLFDAVKERAQKEILPMPALQGKPQDPQRETRHLPGMPEFPKMHIH